MVYKKIICQKVKPKIFEHKKVRSPKNRLESNIKNKRKSQSENTSIGIYKKLAPQLNSNKNLRIDEEFHNSDTIRGRIKNRVKGHNLSEYKSKVNDLENFDKNYYQYAHKQVLNHCANKSINKILNEKRSSVKPTIIAVSHPYEKSHIKENRTLIKEIFNNDWIKRNNEELLYEFTFNPKDKWKLHKE